MTQTIALHHVKAVMRGAVKRGIDVDRVLTGAGIPPGLLADEKARVMPEQYTRLINELWQELDDELLGLGPVPNRLGTFATMCELVIRCPDLRAVLDKAAAFYRLFAMPPLVRLAEEEDTTAIEIGEGDVDDPDHFLTEAVLVILHRLGGWLIGRRIQLRRVEFAFPAPAHAAEYDLMFGCPIRCGAGRTALVFDTTDLKAPVVRDEAELAEFLEDAPAKWLARRDYGTSVAAQVRRILARSIDTDLEAVAGRLSVSPQTVRRQLGAEGTSFSAIKDEIRRDAAIESLVRTDDPIEEIAVRLGFAEASTFHRAFRRWTGSSPGAYRLASR